ncbi:hypothetical protein [Caulobacter sp. UNC279MFTsu5.1]
MAKSDRRLVRRVRQRYGVEEVRKWFFGVWNEPNLDGFWKRLIRPLFRAL